MAARFVRPLFANLDRGTGVAAAPMMRGVPTGASERGPVAAPASAQSAKSFDDRSIKVERDGEMIAKLPGDAPLPSPAATRDDGSIKVQRDDVVEERREPVLSPPRRTSQSGTIGAQGENKPVAEQRKEPPPLLKNPGQGFIKLVREGPGTDAQAEPSLHHRTARLDEKAIRVRDGQAKVDEYARALRTPSPEPQDEFSFNAVRNDQTVAEEQDTSSVSAHPNTKLVLEELEREPRFAYRPPRNHRDDERLSTGTIVGIAAAVIALGLGFTTLLPSLLTRDPVEPDVTFTSAPPAVVQPAQTKGAGAVQAVPTPAPAPPPQVVAPAPTPSSVESAGKTTPALRGSNASRAQTEGRAAEEALVPSAGKAPGRTTLTAAEKAAVTRGLQELDKRAAVATPPRPAPSQRQLTAEEKAAVERGLRELKKAAEQGKP